MGMKFTFLSPQRLYFGPDSIKQLGRIASGYGTHILLITGAESFRKSACFSDLFTAFKTARLDIKIETVSKEPSPEIIDTITRKYCGQKINAVAAIGGGSVLDAGKAVSAMLLQKDSIIQFLEGVGSQVHDGRKLPFIACPTTAGTGSEATKNAVISQTGKKGFKKSLRHDNFIPDAAIVDPQLTLTSPELVTAACGMDALTQLIESFVSPKASVMTDSVCKAALKTLDNALIQVMDRPTDLLLRTRISYAAYISGLTLANAGLGTIHGFASAIGGLLDIPHGVICGTLLAQTTRKNIEALMEENPDHPALKKYSRIARLLDPDYTNTDPVSGAQHLADLLNQWTHLLKIPALGDYGMNESDIESIISSTDQKNNPCLLDKETLKTILRQRI